MRRPRELVALLVLGSLHGCQSEPEAPLPPEVVVAAERRPLEDSLRGALNGFEVRLHYDRHGDLVHGYFPEPERARTTPPWSDMFGDGGLPLELGLILPDDRRFSDRVRWSPELSAWSARQFEVVPDVPQPPTPHIEEAMRLVSHALECEPGSIRGSIPESAGVRWPRAGPWFGSRRSVLFPAVAFADDRPPREDWGD
jgi:hypothetical protein